MKKFLVILLVMLYAALMPIDKHVCTGQSGHFLENGVFVQGCWEVGCVE